MKSKSCACFWSCTCFVVQRPHLALRPAYRPGSREHHDPSAGRISEKRETSRIKGWLDVDTCGHSKKTHLSRSFTHFHPVRDSSSHENDCPGNARHFSFIEHWNRCKNGANSDLSWFFSWFCAGFNITLRENIARYFGVPVRGAQLAMGASTRSLSRDSKGSKKGHYTSLSELLQQLLRINIWVCPFIVQLRLLSAS